MEKQLGNVQKAEEQAGFANPSSSMIWRPPSPKALYEDWRDLQTSDQTNSREVNETCPQVHRGT